MLQRLAVLAALAALTLPAYSQQWSLTEAAGQTIFHNQGKLGIATVTLICKESNEIRASLDMVSPWLNPGQSETIAATNCQLDFVLWTDGSFEGPDRMKTQEAVLHRLAARAQAAEDYLIARDKGTVAQLLQEKGAHRGVDHDYSSYIRELCRMFLGRIGASPMPDAADALAKEYVQKRPIIFRKLTEVTPGAAVGPCTWCVLKQPLQCWQDWTTTNVLSFEGRTATTASSFCEVNKALDGSGQAIVSRTSAVCYDSSQYYGIGSVSANRGIAAVGCPSLIEGWTDLQNGSTSKGIVANVSAWVQITSDVTGQWLKDGYQKSPCFENPTNLIFTNVCPNYIGHYAMW